MQANIDTGTHISLSKYHSRSFWIIFHGTGTRSGSSKCDHLFCSVSTQITPKAAPWTAARGSGHLQHSPGTFLLAASYSRLAFRPSQGSTHRNSTLPPSLNTAASSEDGSMRNQGFLWPSLLDLQTLTDGLPRALGSARWHYSVCLHMNRIYISGLRNVPVD